MQSIRFGGASRERRGWPFFRGGSWRRVRKAWVYAGGAWRQYFTGVEPIIATIDPAALFAFSNNNTTVSGGVTVSITGGLAPFSYSWSVVSYSGTLPTITGGTTATPTFFQTGVAVETFETATFRVTVTDSSAQTTTADVLAEFYNNSFS